MTPLIDIVLQLIIFFMLVSQFAGVENVPVDLPQLTRGRPESLQPEDKVVITLRKLAGEERPVVQVGPTITANLKDLEAILRRVKATSPTVEAVVRADKRLQYKYLKNVMSILARCRIERMQIAVSAEPGRSQSDAGGAM